MMPDLSEGLREQVARLIHDSVADTDPDELIHEPYQKSWDEPTRPRWTQWLETTDAILALLRALAVKEKDLEE